MVSWFGICRLVLCHLGGVLLSMKAGHVRCCAASWLEALISSVLLPIICLRMSLWILQWKAVIDPSLSDQRFLHLVQFLSIHLSASSEL